MPKLKASQFCKIDFAHTFKLESVTVMSFENHDIGRLAKYNCLILEKNANYRTPLKKSLRWKIGFTLVIVCGKLKRLLPKITLIKRSLLLTFIFLSVPLQRGGQEMIEWKERVFGCPPYVGSSNRLLGPRGGDMSHL